MQPDPISILRDTPFLEVVHLFVVGRIGGAPVVDERGTILGILSTTDLLRVVDQTCDEDVDPQPPGTGTPGDEGELAERLSVLKAIDVVTPDAVWVSPATPIAEVAKLMRTQGIHRVLVGDERRVAGILTAFDLLKALEG